MTDNRDEIVRLAVELATDVAGEAKVRHDDKVAKAKRLLALASPPEPKRWPVGGWQPEIVKNVRGRFFVRQGANESYWQMSGPACDTPAAAVEAWNAMIDCIAGADDETVLLVGDLAGMLNHPDADVLHRARRWLAERTGGSDGR